MLRKIMGIKFWGVLCVLCLCVPGAFAQPSTTVGEILDKGGKSLNQEVVSALLIGATVSGIQTARPDVKFQLTYRPDGTISGSAIRWQTQTGYASVSGKWSITEKGQVCNALRNSYGKIPEGTGNCNFWFKSGSEYHIAASEAREQLAYPREVRR